MFAATRNVFGIYVFLSLAYGYNMLFVFSVHTEQCRIQKKSVFY